MIYAPLKGRVFVFPICYSQSVTFWNSVRFTISFFQFCFDGGKGKDYLKVYFLLANWLDLGFLLKLLSSQIEIKHKN